MKRVTFLIFLVVALVALGACNQSEPKADEENRTVNVGVKTEGEKELEVELINNDGAVLGAATLSQEDSGVHISVDATHLPAGLHGFHIHERGLCEGPDFESAGGHFNPGNNKHGFDHPEGPHAGDLPNLEVGEDGVAKTEIIADLVTLEKGKINSLFHEGGTSLVIHADPDDYVSQPAGDSGDRIACGVIAE